MNNSNIYKADTDDLRNLPEDEQDFNYSTYPTAQVQISENNLVPEGANESYAYLSSAVGGSVSQISFKSRKKPIRGY